jgi:hypothetical protein
MFEGQILELRFNSPIVSVTNFFLPNAYLAEGYLTILPFLRIPLLYLSVLYEFLQIYHTQNSKPHIVLPLLLRWHDTLAS